jgi:Rhodanese-like domain
VRALDCGSLARSLSGGGGGGGSILLIDIRPFLAFNLSHIAGSVNINCQVGIKLNILKGACACAEPFGAENLLRH